jgi:hypothetical protein
VRRFYEAALYVGLFRGLSLSFPHLFISFVPTYPPTSLPRTQTPPFPHPLSAPPLPFLTRTVCPSRSNQSQSIPIPLSFPSSFPFPSRAPPIPS